VDSLAYQTIIECQAHSSLISDDSSKYIKVSAIELKFNHPKKFIENMKSCVCIQEPGEINMRPFKKTASKSIV
jgi:hypothetical protein